MLDRVITFEHASIALNKDPVARGVAPNREFEFASRGVLSAACKEKTN
jgi:hypothetical protein